MSHSIITARNDHINDQMTKSDQMTKCFAWRRVRVGLG